MEKTKIVFASSNPGKIKEVREILSDFEVLSLKDIGFTGEIIEDGKSFYENALIKAKTVSLATGYPALADDSGICINALNKEPGIYSARYSGKGDKENNLLVLKNMEGKTDRSAYYVCSLVYYKPNGEIVSEEKETHGQILFEETGTNGFGYDSIFYSDDLKKPMGLASSEEKNAISHRGRALQAIKDKIK